MSAIRSVNAVGVLRRPTRRTPVCSVRLCVFVSLFWTAASVRSAASRTPRKTQNGCNVVFCGRAVINGKRLAVVLPAYNAARTLAATVSELPDIVDDRILVDDGSRDDTAAIA